MEENFDYVDKMVYVWFRKKVGRIGQYSIPMRGYFVEYDSPPWNDRVTDLEKHCLFLTPLDLFLIQGTR